MNGVDYSQEESEEIRKLKRQISDLKEENEFLKKPLRTSAKKSGEVRYIRSLTGEYSILKMCGWLGVSRAGYYKWLSRGTSESEKRQQSLEKVIATERQGWPWS